MNLQFINLPSTVSYKYMINPNYYFLKAYYKYKSKNFDKINWFEYQHEPIFDIDYYIEMLQSNKIDIVCFSIFVWNTQTSFDIAKEYKRVNPNAKIVFGGPNVHSLTVEDLSTTCDFIDYAIYGDGEAAFVEVIDSIVEQRPLGDKAVNIMTKDTRYPHQVFDDLGYKKCSPYLMLQDEIRDYVKKIQKTHKLDPWRIDLKYERARGCPYKCAFCDWSGGLHNKVKRKENDWKEEIDFIISLGVSFSPVDANWGIFEEDLEIADYAVDRSWFTVQNIAKINKERVFRLYDILARSNNGQRGMKFSLQDINEVVLDNIDRPDERWEVQKPFIKEFKKKYSNIVLFPEIMIGLPGQTVDNFLYMLDEFTKIGFPHTQQYMWELIPASPACRPEYIEKYKLEWADVYDLEFTKTVRFSSIDELQEIARTRKEPLIKTKKIIGTYSAGLPEILTMFTLGWYYPIVLRETDPSTTRTVLREISSNILRYFKAQEPWIREHKILASEHPKKPGVYIPFREYALIMPWEELFMNP